MSFLNNIINEKCVMYFSFGGYDYHDEIKIRLEIKKNKLNMSYLTVGMNHLKIKPKIIPNNTTKYKVILQNTGFNSNNDFMIIESTITDNTCITNNKIKKIFILEKAGYYRLYEYLKVKNGIFSYNYCNQIIYNEY